MAFVFSAALSILCTIIKSWYISLFSVLENHPHLMSMSAVVDPDSLLFISIFADGHSSKGRQTSLSTVDFRWTMMLTYLLAFLSSC